MGEVGGWAAMRERRMAEPGAKEAYEATRLAFKLGRAVRELRERRGWKPETVGDGIRNDAVGRSPVRGRRDGPEARSVGTAGDSTGCASHGRV